MRKRLIALLILSLWLLSISASAEDTGLIKMRATAYKLQGVTASGQPVRYGVCATGRSEWLGKTVVMYQRLPDGSVGELIGIYECLDTGCSQYVIDVWKPDLDECQAFMDRVYEDGCNGKVYIQLFECEG